MNKKKQLTNYVQQVTASQLSKLYRELIKRGFSFEKLPYTHWKAKQGKLNITAYQSGKLVIQGKGTEDFVLFILEPLILKKAECGYEEILNPQKSKKNIFTPHIGIDESGKGDFFGPLVISAVYTDNKSSEQLEKLGVKDSKLIKNDSKILDIAKKIRNTVNGKFTVVAIGPEAYNRIYKNFKNLNRLLAWGHARALENLLDKDINCKYALSDKFGNEKLILDTLFEKGKQIELQQKTKAESDIAVAAASILARADFITRMKKIGENIGTNLPKGAGKNVLETAVEIINNKGIDSLEAAAKMHFKTYETAVNNSYLKL
ncbi:MAG: ribonuclease HIII [Victivallales bacterium]|nr:ribonuclease HIII [Victivallales bacterium]